MAKVRTLEPKIVEQCYALLKDPMVTYREAAEACGISLATAQRIARGEYPECPKPLLRKSPATGTRASKARGLRLDPDADKLIDYYCGVYATSRSQFVSNLVIKFDQSLQRKA